MYRAGQRFDCRAVGAIRLRLGQVAGEVVAQEKAFRERRGGYDPDTQKQNEDWRSQGLAQVTLQGEHGKWKCCALIIEALPVSIRFACVTLEGKDTQFWQGHYGMKFAGPRLTWSSREHARNHCGCSRECLHAVFAPEGAPSGVTQKVWHQ